MKNTSGVLETDLIALGIPSTHYVRHAALESPGQKASIYPSHLTPKILAPIDLSGDSKGAIEHAIDVARAMGAELSLLHVTDPHSRTRAVGPPVFDPALPGSIGQFVVTGSVPETIPNFAEFVDADFVLMTSEKYRGWHRFWKPSVTAQVLKSTRRPVLVTGAMDTDARFRCRRILCALALDGNDSATVLHAEALARRTGSELILLNVVPEVDEGMLHEVLSGGDRPLSTHLANDRIRKIGRSLSVPYKTSVMIGSPSKCISLAVREYAADIVVAPRFDFDTRAVFRRLTCPLLSVAGTAPLVRRAGLYPLKGL